MHILYMYIYVNNRMGKTRDLFRKLEIPREYLMQRWDQYRTETVGI